MTYDGLESILKSCSYDNGRSSGSGISRVDGGPTTSDSLDEDAASSYSSTKDSYSSSFSSQCLTSTKQEEEQALIEWEPLHSLNNLCVNKRKAQITCTMHFSDVEAMKERFAKLLLEEDVLRGTRGIS